MQTRDIVGFILVPVVLLAAAWLISDYQLWNPVASLTIPWFCTALALALLVLGATCLIVGAAPAAVPMKAALVIYGVTVIVVAVGLVVDGLDDLDGGTALTSLVEWVGFSLILLAVFMAPRLGPSEPAA
jgi:hypothetical protein